MEQGGAANASSASGRAIARRCLQPGFALFALAAGLYVAAAWLLLPPLLGSVDTGFFKDSGINLALGRGLTSSFAFGNPTAEPRIYAGYPPGLPLVFAGYSLLAGIGPAANMLFELLVETLLLLVAYRLLAPAFAGASRWERWAFFATLLLLLPARYTLSQGDRPDALGLTLALLTLLPGVASRRAAAASALLAGAALLFSFMCGLLAAAAVALRWLAAPAASRVPLAPMAALGALGLLLPLGLALAVLGGLDGSYPERLLGFVTVNTASAASLVAGDATAWWTLIVRQSDGLHYWLGLAPPAILLAAASGLLLSARRDLRPGSAALAALLIWSVVIFSLVVIPWNRLYGGLAAGLFLPALAVVLPAGFWARRRSRIFLLAALLALALPRLPLEGYARLAQAGLGQSHVRAAERMASLPWSDRNGDGAVWISVDPQAYFLVKPLGHRIFVSNFWLVTPEDFAGLLDYVVLAYGPGGGPRSPREPDWWPLLRDRFELVERPALPQYVTLFGRQISRSSYSWEVEIWRRRD